MKTLLTIAILASGIALPSLAPAVEVEVVEPGLRCELIRTLQTTNKKRGRRKSKVRRGAGVRVIGITKQWARIRSGRKRVWVRRDNTPWWSATKMKTKMNG